MHMINPLLVPRYGKYKNWRMGPIWFGPINRLNVTEKTTKERLILNRCLARRPSTLNCHPRKPRWKVSSHSCSSYAKTGLKRIKLPKCLILGIDLEFGKWEFIKRAMRWDAFLFF